MGQMTPLPMEQARHLLGSPNWYARVAAVNFFERKGSEDDVKRLDAVKADKSAVKGPRWGKTKTVGEVAEEALSSAKQRLAQANAQ
jgi:hypothetical protein